MTIETLRTTTSALAIALATALAVTTAGCYVDFDGDGDDFADDDIADDDIEHYADTTELIATPTPLINLALGRPTTQSATLFGGDAARAVDGNTDGWFWSNSVTHTDSGPSWWQVDLGGVEPVGEVVVHNRTDCCGERLHDFDVAVSADGVNWERFRQAGLAGAKTHAVVNRPARYVRVENPEVLHMAEVEVFRTTNLAYGRPATQSSVAAGGDPARAVDGNTNGDYGAGSVTHTVAGSAWWQVDLQGVYSVGQVVLFNRTDCCADRLRDFTVSVSNDGVTWQGFTFSGPAAPRVLVPVNRDARYVRVANGGPDALSLAEVQVFAQPTLPGLSYGRGVGTVPAYGCAPGQQYDAGLCYDWCAPGYTNVLNLCYQNCAPGYTDMGLYCMDYGTFGWPSYWKHIYDRGVGTPLIPTCGAGQDLDAGLCYPSCDLGYTGVGPVCWLSGITIGDITAAACDLLRVPIISQLAKEGGVTLTSGAGLSVAAGATGSVELGVAYGDGGEFGCYVSACAGVTPDISIGAYAAMGAYDGFGSVAGDSVVTSAGLSIGIPETPISLGGSLGLVADTSGAPIGATVNAILGLGLDAATPISVGVLTCHTEVLQTQP